MSTTVKSARDVVQHYVDTLAEGDVEAVRAHFAPDATWMLHGSLPLSGTWHGRDAIVDKFLSVARGYFVVESIAIEVTNLLAAGDDTAVLEWTSRAQTLSGRSYENYCIGVFEVRDGAISRVREYMDTDYARRVAFS